MNLTLSARQDLLAGFLPFCPPLLLHTTICLVEAPCGAPVSSSVSSLSILPFLPWTHILTTCISLGIDADCCSRVQIPLFLIRNYKYEDAERWSLSVWECACLRVPMRFALQSLCIWEQQLRTDGRLLAFALMSNSLTGLLCVSSVRSAPESLLVLVYNLLDSNFRFSCKWKFDKGHMISRIPSVLYVWSLWLLSPIVTNAT